LPAKKKGTRPGLWQRLFGGVRPAKDEPASVGSPLRVSQTEAPARGSRERKITALPGTSSVSYGIFFFNSGDEDITENYGYHAKKAVRERIRERDRRVLASEWLVHHGDILLGLDAVRINMKNILTDDGCNSKKLDTTLKTSLAKGVDPGYVPYAIGMFGITFADERLRRDRIAVYNWLTHCRRTG